MNRLIQWFVENKVAANLLMVLIFIGAFMSTTKLDKEVFPTIAINYIQVSMSYPGAGPSEVEQQVVIRIEEAVADLDGVEEIVARANQGFGTVTIKVMEGYDAQQVLNEVKTRVDAIDTFPGAVERPVTTQIVGRSPLMSLALHGDVDEAALKETAHWVRNELSLLPGVSHVALNGTRPYQMGIEVSEQALRRHQLTFEQIATAIRASSLNVPAGQIRAHEGDIQIQTRNQAYTADDFGAIPVITRADGTRVLLRDIADIRDGFDQWDVFAQFNGQPAAFLELSITENPDIVASAKEVRAYMESVQLPSGVQLTVWQDASELYESRLNLLLGNALQGLLLVFIVLMLFLRPLLALWVCVGIATAFAGAVWLLPYTGVSVNMISLFAFLLVLGIVVDDAIIVGENIYSRQQHGLKGAASAASGAKMVAVPVFFAVISTMIFFAPMLAIPGPMGTITFAIPAVVILCLVFSLIECLFILPSHLAHMKPEQESRFASLRKLSNGRRKLASGLDWVGDRVYLRGLHHFLRHKFATLSAFVVAFVLSLTLFMTGWLTTSFMPQVPSDYVEARVVLPEGTPFHETRRVMRQVEGAALQLAADPELRVSAQRDFIDGITTWAWGVNVYVAVNLAAAENREISSPEVSRRWRELIGDIPEAREYRLDFTINEPGDDIRLNLSIADNDPNAQRAIAERVSQALREYPETSNVRNSMEAERPEIELTLRPGAEMLGISLDQVARQVRQAYYGEEAQRIPRGVEDVRVLVRYSQQERDDLFHLDQMRVRTADGAQVPLLSVADVNFVPGYSSIERLDRKRNITLTAELEEGGDAQAIVADLMDRHMPEWRQQFPGLTLTPDGTMQDQADFMSTLGKNFLLAVLVIYGLMAVNFRSYWQPLMILTAIPFGFMGAIIGHLIMGREVSMLSMLGFVAAAGVVVNDNLVLLDRINTLRRQGMEVLEAVLQGGRDRFRAIVLTSVTTFIGLMPIMFEQSVQARFLIPMVISLSFGVLFATLVTLILVPTLYVSADRFGQRWTAFWQRNKGDLHEQSA
ncbi:efflux RND transporter permease subunit [Marinimicrobium sp. ABcell2]|uniref:efflux RND transporter permease subunit n=1 Tax=Marinimicrobium sp. ABcell2 TaxID=3069751 RepID=UPI0027B14026|nr:efflux RND transporter permease subunit [Marinimicrobium sp. ABcell2]MDQ2076819.1 efflux RND transporter permease subunit [Marinimicrobium sp. ABcell2]